MHYMTVKEASQKWDLGIRIVTLYCTEGRIDGAVKKGNLWLIPEDAMKPEDRRRKKSLIQQENKRVSADISDIYEQRRHDNASKLQSLYEKQELLAQQHSKDYRKFSTD